jgi:galactofuranosylgalactofuranosylrhamnosyl-N-acetylglucosaminyl-diphospho-decaprenol beta-1,5/1,6-galactofuranosyltransferase
VEYGYRARERGFATVTLPGAALWHADFDWKDADKWSEYFAVRNAMITCALHGRFDPKQVARVISSRVLRNLLSLQYGLAATTLKAAEDFLAGPAILADGGVAAAAEIRELRDRYPETIMHPVSAVPDLVGGPIPVVAAGADQVGNRLLLVKRLVNLVMGRTTYRAGYVPEDAAKWWHLSQFETAVVTDASQEGVRVRRRDRARTIELAKRCARVVRRLLAEGPRLKDEYRAAVPELTTSENWKRLYGI